MAREAQTFTMSCQRHPSGLKVTIADRGLPFDPRSIRSMTLMADWTGR